METINFKIVIKFTETGFQNTSGHAVNVHGNYLRGPPLFLLMTFESPSPTFSGTETRFRLLWCMAVVSIGFRLSRLSWARQPSSPQALLHGMNFG